MQNTGTVSKWLAITAAICVLTLAVIALYSRYRLPAQTGRQLSKEEALQEAAQFKPTGICPQVVTPARNLASGATYTFATGCIPDGWVSDYSHPTPTADPMKVSSLGPAPLNEVLSVSLLTLSSSSSPNDAQSGELVTFLQSSGLTVQLWTADSVRLSGSVKSVEDLFQVKLTKYSVSTQSVPCGTYYSSDSQGVLPDQLVPFFDREDIQWGTTTQASLRQKCTPINPA
jgi:hypothetical protein